jgi:hypothetical protein
LKSSLDSAKKRRKLIFRAEHEKESFEIEVYFDQEFWKVTENLRDFIFYWRNKNQAQKEWNESLDDKKTF